MDHGLFIAIGVIAAYLVVVAHLKRTGRLGGALTAAGPLLMWRTQLGKPTIERLAKRAPRFWAVWGDIGIAATWVMGALVFLLLVLQLYGFAAAPQEASANAPGPELLIGLPGVNPLIPLGYGIVGLVIALVLHEGAHGVLARAGRINVKSLGLLFFVVPVGAFVEPDEADAARAGTRARNRVYAAGPMANLAVALVAGLLFSGVVMANLDVANDGEGMAVSRTEIASPAALAGLRAGDVIAAIDGVPLTNVTVFDAALNGTREGTVLQLDLVRGAERVRVNATLTDRYAWFEEHAPNENNASFAGSGFLGVRVFDARLAGGFAAILTQPFRDGPLDAFVPSRGGSFVLFVSYPFVALVTGLDVLASPLNGLLVPVGVLGALPPAVVFGLASTLYWTFWLSLMLGTFNALPAGPLDGGQMLRNSMRAFMLKRAGVQESDLRVERLPLGYEGIAVFAQDEDTQMRVDAVERRVRTINRSVGFGVLALILVPIVLPPIVRLVA